MAKECTAAQQLMQLMGVGETTATAIVAMVGNAREFDSGRQFAPGSPGAGQYTRRQGRLGRITKAGDAYCAACWCWAPGGAQRGQWQRPILEPLGATAARAPGYWKAVVAIAAKNRAWPGGAHQGESFKLRPEDGADETPARCAAYTFMPPLRHRDQYSFHTRDDEALMCKSWTCVGSDRLTR